MVGYLKSGAARRGEAPAPSRPTPFPACLGAAHYHNATKQSLDRDDLPQENEKPRTYWPPGGLDRELFGLALTLVASGVPTGLVSGPVGGPHSRPPHAWVSAEPGMTGVSCTWEGACVFPLA